MDSTTLLYQLLAKGYEVRCLTFDYGQRHVKEIKAAGQVCADLGIQHKVMRLAALTELMKGSALTDPTVAVPHGSYEDESMKSTVVPNRNMIMASIAAAWAISTDSGNLAYAAHAGDHAIYPDCRPEFIDKLRRVLAICDYKHLDFIAPFSEMDKGQIAKLGVELGVPFEHTWTCYEGKDEPCGKCGSCVERAEAFAFAGAIDPLVPPNPNQPGVGG
jgi:7-cyano-7-deazaguanine synthase